MKPFFLMGLVAIVLAAGSAAAQPVALGPGSVAAAVAGLRPGEFVWAPQIAPAGPVLLIVNLTTQRALLYRNGIPIAATTVSTGRPGYQTPTGIFTVLQKHVEHYSSKYDNAPMPYMQRLTWGGIALHAGKLPGFPASHGCIRLPPDFAHLLFGLTRLGMTVAITDKPTVPRIAATPELALSGSPAADVPAAEMRWNPERSPDGPVSIVVSAADRTAIVLRNGIEIGSAPVVVDGPVAGTWAYALRAIDDRGQHWLKIALSSGADDGQEVGATEWQRFHAPDAFRRAVAGIVRPGTTIIVTADSLQSGGTGLPVTVIDDGAPPAEPLATPRSAPPPPFR